MKRLTLLLVAASLVAALGFYRVTDTLAAADKDAKPVTITGKSACAQCDGDIKGHDVMLYTDGGIRFVVKGSGAAYKAAHKVRKDGKTMTAVLAGPIVAKKDKNKKAYLEVACVDIKIKKKNNDKRL